MQLESALEAKTLALQHSRDELTLIQKRLEASNTLGSSQGKSTAELEAALAQVQLTVGSRGWLCLRLEIAAE
jgi:hypothetical protein